MKKNIYRTMYCVALFAAKGASAQSADSANEERFSVHAQSTIINQNKLKFDAPYTGPNSLTTDKESRTSITSTLFLGARLWKGASLFLNPEIAGGAGLSQTLGLGDATNGETFRIGDAAPKVYLARLYFSQRFNLGKTASAQSSDFNQLAGKVPEHYAAFTIGKIAFADYFDRNKYSHDPRTQFMCWGLMSNGAWDYPANTRGYTPSIVLEYVNPHYELRYGIALLPKTANGNEMNWNIAKSVSQNIEYTHKYRIKGQQGAIRLLAFYNIAAMGNYRQSISEQPINPNVVSVRGSINNKYGFGLNIEQDINKEMGCFFRASWNDGNNETWAFTEIDHSLSAGLCMSGNRWHRSQDNMGIAYVVSGLSAAHREYLAAGGTAFMLGEGRLNYGLEKLGEVYYKAALNEHIYVTGAYQIITNPGYNMDRPGPVHVFSIRVHTRI